LFRANQPLFTPQIEVSTSSSVRPPAVTSSSSSSSSAFTPVNKVATTTATAAAGEEEERRAPLLRLRLEPHAGDNSAEILADCPLEHPFFVKEKGESSSCPLSTGKRGLRTAKRRQFFPPLEYARSALRRRSYEMLFFLLSLFWRTA